MTVLTMFSPRTLTVGGSGLNYLTEFVANPWGDSAPVWIQCATQYVAGDGQSEFGIQDLFFFDDQGIFQLKSFGDVNSPFGNFAARWFAPRFVGVTVAGKTFDAVIKGTTTLFLWG